MQKEGGLLSMGGAPRIWLKYRPIRIGWLISGRSLAQLARAATWSAALWGGRFNPFVPIHDQPLSEMLVRTFGVDLLIPVESDSESHRFTEKFPHLRSPMTWGQQPFEGGRCNFVDVRHAVRRISERLAARRSVALPKFLRPTWKQDDPLSTLFSVLIGQYPPVDEVRINYGKGIDSSLESSEMPIARDAPLSPDLHEAFVPLDLTASEITLDRDPSGWLAPGFVLGSALDFDDLILLWNLRAAGARLHFYDGEHAGRLMPYVTAFLTSLRDRTVGSPSRVNIWSRNSKFDSDLDLAGFERTHCGGAGDGLWNGSNVKPSRLRFAMWHRDVLPSYDESETGASASFALSGQPFNEEDNDTRNQHFVISIEVTQFNSARDDFTFSTPFLPSLNEFYGRYFHFIYDEARSEPGFFNRGAVGIFVTVGTQRLQVNSYRVHHFIQALFDTFGVTITRSDPPGLLCARLVRQLGGVQGCRVFKVRGARTLIEEYRPDQSFTRSAALMRIGNIDPQANKPRFSEFEDLYLEPRDGGKLQPSAVFDYLVSRGVFRVGLDLECSNCQLSSWVPLDDVRTLTTCLFCGYQFDITRQLKDRDWRYRRSGLFGRDDHQEGSIPVALTIQQLETSLHDRILMYSTALKFSDKGRKIENCEADFLAIVAGEAGIGEAPVQILLGEAKTRKEIDAEDVRKLGKLAEAIPKEIAATFIMFAKTAAFSADEIRLANTLNSQFCQRVILWSQDELEPYFVYERSKERLGGRGAVSLTDMVRNTHELFFK